MARVVRAKKNFQADALLEHLQSWARKADVVNTPYVAGLTTAISAKKDLHIWATLEPFQYLPYPVIKVGARIARLVRILTVLRNVLVFAPVALTWAAVGEATSGFAAYVKENGANVVNFLDFWQNGYGYLGSEWRIANVAQLDFVIILIVIALTIYISVAGSRAAEVQAKLEAEIDDDRTAVAIEIAAFLYSKRQVSNVTMNASLAASLSKLLNAADALENSSKAIAVTSKNFEKASRKITPYA